MPPALLDTNVLVHAAHRGSPLHPAAARILDLALRVRGRYCIAPQNLVEFCAVVTRARFVDPPLPATEAERMAGILYRSRRLAKIHPRRGTIRRALREGAARGVAGARWYDLFLAMTMRDAGVRVIVTESRRDFAPFPFVTAQSLEREAKLVP